MSHRLDENSRNLYFTELCIEKVALNSCCAEDDQFWDILWSKILLIKLKDFPGEITDQLIS